MKEGEYLECDSSTVQITVQYRCIFVLLFGRYSLQLDNKYRQAMLMSGNDCFNYIGTRLSVKAVYITG